MFSCVFHQDFLQCETDEIECVFITTLIPNKRLQTKYKVQLNINYFNDNGEMYVPLTREVANQFLIQKTPGRI